MAAQGKRDEREGVSDARKIATDLAGCRPDTR